MRLSTVSGCRRLSCSPAAGRGFRFSAPVSCGYGSETALYAACRYLRHDERTAHELVAESYRLRFAGKGARRSTRRTLLLPAALMELPCAWARLRVSVDREGVRVESLELFERFPGVGL